MIPTSPVVCLHNASKYLSLNCRRFSVGCGLLYVFALVVLLSGCRHKVSQPSGQPSGNVGIVKRVVYDSSDDTTTVYFFGDSASEHHEVFCGNRKGDFKYGNLYALSDQLYKDTFGDRECFEIVAMDSWEPDERSDSRGEKPLTEPKIQVVGGLVQKVNRSSSGPALAVDFQSRDGRVTTVSFCDAGPVHQDLSRNVQEYTYTAVRYDLAKYSDRLGCYVAYAAWHYTP